MCEETNLCLNSPFLHFISSSYLPKSSTFVLIEDIFNLMLGSSFLHYTRVLICCSGSSCKVQGIRLRFSRNINCSSQYFEGSKRCYLSFIVIETSPAYLYVEYYLGKCAGILLKVLWHKFDST